MQVFWVIFTIYPQGEVIVAHSFVGLRCGRMALETVPKDLRHLRACLLCSLVKVSVGDLVVLADGRPIWGKEGGTDVREQ